MRTTKRCTAEQFEKAVKGRQFTEGRLAAARRVLVDGETVAAVVENSGQSVFSVRQGVQLIFDLVKAQFEPVNPDRKARPGFVILTVEIPELASAGLLAGVATAGGVLLEKITHGD